MNEFEKALKAGREIVVVSAGKNDDSAIFFCDRSGVLFSYSRNIGEIKRTDKSITEIAEHIKNMNDNLDAHVFIRGCF